MMQKDIEILKVLIEENFKILEKKVEENDENIKKLLTSVEKESVVYNRPLVIEDIPIISYLDE